MQKLSKKYIAVSVLLVFILLLSSCGAAKSADSVMENEYAYADGEYGTKTSAKPAESVDVIADAASRKLIKNAELSVQTKQFDVFTKKLAQAVNKAGGYIEDSNVTGNNYYYEGNRSADYVLRIPADKFDTFISEISGLATLNSKKIGVKDVTSSYIDTESHIKALETEQTALLDILAKAETVTDIIEVQSRLSEVRAELESWKSQLQTLDAQIAYSEVTLYVNEVEHEINAAKQGFGSEIKERLSDNFFNVITGIKNFVIWFISSIPYFLIFAVIAVPVFFILRFIHRKRKQKKNKNV